MKIPIIALAAISGGALLAQAPDPSKGAIAYQHISAMGGPGGPVMFHMMGLEGLGGPTVAGKPMSATQQQHSLEVLADGTRIENTETHLFYRDEQGRTRTEHGLAGATHVMIHDPVAGTSVMLDPVNKVAHKLEGHGDPASIPPGAHAQMMVHHGGHMAMATAAGGDVMFKRTEVEMPKPTVEDLGSETVNGVLAKGTRTTTTIPTGTMGNDRPMQVVTERWYSDDLQTLVKSVNKDPRFGETTFELTNIERTAPPASMFQIPSDYKVEEGPEKFVISAPGQTEAK
jgi:hypothetical protein